MAGQEGTEIKSRSGGPEPDIPQPQSSSSRRAGHRGRAGCPAAEPAALAGWKSLLIGTLGGGRGGKGGACILLSSRGVERRTLSFLQPILSFLPRMEGLGCKILRPVAPGGPRRPVKWPGLLGQPPIRTQKRGSHRTRPGRRLAPSSRNELPRYYEHSSRQKSKTN